MLDTPTFYENFREILMWRQKRKKIKVPLTSTNKSNVESHSHSSLSRSISCHPQRVLSFLDGVYLSGWVGSLLSIYLLPAKREYDRKHFWKSQKHHEWSKKKKKRFWSKQWDSPKLWSRLAEVTHFDIYSTGTRSRLD